MILQRDRSMGRLKSEMSPHKPPKQNCSKGAKVIIKGRINSFQQMVLEQVDIYRPKKKKKK